MVNPSAEAVAAFVGTDTPGEGWTAKANTTLGIVTQMVHSYTRGNGFEAYNEPNEALGAVIVSASARLMANPELTRSQTAGPFTINHGTFNGWTLPELAILHAYRRRTC